MHKDNFFSFEASDIKALAEALKKKYAVFSPWKDEKDFLKWAQEDISLDYSGNTMMPLKHHFLPRFEKLFAFKGKKGKVELQAAGVLKETVFWGVRPCDLKSMELLDRVFLSPEFADSRYKEKREKTLLVAFHCHEPYQTCFCTSLQYDLADKNTSDIIFFGMDGGHYLGLVSERGEQLLSEASIKKTQASGEQVSELEKMLEAFKDKFAIKFELDDKPKELKSLFEDPYFEEAAFKCLSCGICSFVCPSCHCFAIEDNVAGNEGYRARSQDHCLNPDFTVMAGGYNPRILKSSRLRQRFLHKGYYFKEQFGALGCVGCGRCLAKCPVSMDICDALIHIRGGKFRR